MANANTRVVLDLVRDTNTIIDLTPYFQGRVGDSDSFLPVALLSDGRATDLTGKDVVFQGNDPNNAPFTIYGKAQQSMHADSWKRGRFTFYFPAETFQVPGVWDAAFLRVVDSNVDDPSKSTAIVSTLNLHLNVLPDDVSMVVTRKAYHSGLESIVDEFNAYMENKKKQIENIASSLTNSYPEIIAKYQTLKALDDSVQEMINNKQVATIDDLGTNLIENNVGGLPTPAMYIEKGFYRIHYGYAYLGDLDIVPGKTVDATDCEQVAMVQTTVLNNIVSQEATVQAKNDYVYKLERKSTGDTTWSKWHAVAQF